jgi:hypothetical protein
VLHRQQVALNINDFDITNQVAAELNRILPSVNIPPDGVAPTAQLPVQLAPGALVAVGATAPAATPAAAPAAAPAPASPAKK